MSPFLAQNPPSKKCDFGVETFRTVVSESTQTVPGGKVGLWGGRRGKSPERTRVDGPRGPDEKEVGGGPTFRLGERRKRLLG